MSEYTMLEYEKVMLKFLNRGHQIMIDCDQTDWNQGFDHAVNWMGKALERLNPAFDFVAFKKTVYKRREA